MRGDGKNGVRVAGVALSNPDRILYPELGFTKRALAEFYAGISEWILPHVTGRPVSLLRCPNGRQKPCFFQKHFDQGFPSGISPITIQESDQEEAEYLLIRDLPGLIGLVQMSALELHPWGSRAENLERPDWLVFDLDPGEGVEWKEVIAAARLSRKRLADLGLRGFVKTSGGKGLHVVVPLTPKADWDQVHAFSAAFAKSLEEKDPQRYTSTPTKSKRRGKIFIDYLRNTRGATSVAAYSTRARPGAPVSTPLRWEELSSLESALAYHLVNLPRRLAALKRDPWEGFFELEQELVGL